jgi:photosystem II stability/assembly factor-like uncharacterized protein
VGLFDSVLHTTDGGETWVAEPTGAPFGLACVAFNDLGEGWAVGGGGTILHSIDGGTTWDPPSMVTSLGLECVLFVDRYTGWAVGSRGTILRSRDGGTTWIEEEGGTPRDLKSLFFADTLKGWTVGGNGTILHTVDGGLTWTAQVGGTSSDLECITFLDVATGWAVGESGIILHTEDGGTNWAAQPSGTEVTLRAITFQDSVNGWAIGETGTILFTQDAGGTWTQQASLTNEDLYAVSVDLEGSLWAVGSAGTILRTTDLGTTWTTVVSGVTNDLSCIDFADLNAGWVVGDGGAILTTSDGGDSWAVQETGCGSSLEFVWFVDPHVGWAVGAQGTILNASRKEGGIEPPPTLLSPSNGATGISTDPVLTWLGSGGSRSFTLQVSEFDDFSNLVVDVDSLIESFFNLAGLEDGTTYYWHVNAQNAYGSSEWSEAWSFTTIFELPEQVNLLKPDPNTVVNVDSVTFRWQKAEAGVDRYWLEVDADSQFTTPIIDSTLVDTTTTLHQLQNQTYWWRVRANNAAGWGEFSDPWSFSILVTDVQDQERVPTEFNLKQNFPNPFNPVTTIRYELPKRSHVTVEVFNFLGERVAILVDEEKEIGFYQIILDGGDLASGAYIYRLRVGDFVQTRKMILVR